MPGTPGAENPRRDWRYWITQAGRGWGKTRVGAESCREAVEQGIRRIALIGPTAGDVRDVMVEGESGILSVCPSWDKPVFEPSKRRVVWPAGQNGRKRRAIATMYSADQPDRLRGPQHEFGWCDELAAWRRGQEAWDNFLMGLRLGPNPRVVVTTTPRPIKLMRELTRDPEAIVTRGSTYENAANVAPQWLQVILRKYEGTTLGRQELMAELLSELPGALWTRAMFERSRIALKDVPPLVRIVVAVDPAVTAEDESNETGIIVAGMGYPKGSTVMHGYVFQDSTLRASPGEWASIVVDLYGKYRADRVVAETNNGGDLVNAVLQNATPGAVLPFRAVHASRGKARRAEPVAALYEQNRVHHVIGQDLSDLEDQCCNYVPGVSDDSPDRMDALVWGIFDLMIAPSDESLIVQVDGHRIIPPGHY